jgi:hypothetical protein
MAKAQKPPKIGEKVWVWKGRGETRRVIEGVAFGYADDYGDALVYVAWVDPKQGPKCDGFYAADVLRAPPIDRVPPEDYPPGWRSDLRWVTWMDPGWPAHCASQATR